MPYIPNLGKKITVTITPYEKSLSPFESAAKTVWVQKGEEHPDPSKRMIWGTAPDGSTVSDFKGFFTKKGKPITFDVDISGLWTAMEENERVQEAIKKVARERP